jgi:lysophospholipase L1-like esterase
MRVYVLGDSISIQYGPHLEAQLKGKMDYARKHAEDEALMNLDEPGDANGGDSSRVLDFLRFSAKNGTINADLLLLNCGLHDIKTDPASGTRQVPVDQYRANLQAIIQTVEGMPPELVWIRTTPCDEAVHNYEGITFHRFAADCDAYNGVADDVMQQAGVPIIDLHRFTRDLGEDLFRDHVHFHPHVQASQAAFLADWLTNPANWKPARDGKTRRAHKQPQQNDSISDQACG